MTKQYIVFDAATGKNNRYDTKEEAIEAFWKNVIKFAKSHFNNNVYLVAETMPNGAERWYNDKNQEIDRPMTPQEIEALIEKVRAEMEQQSN